MTGVLYSARMNSFEVIFYFLYLLCQILEAAHRIGASDMKKHALDLVVGHFVKVIKPGGEGPY